MRVINANSFLFAHIRSPVNLSVGICQIYCQFGTRKYESDARIFWRYDTYLFITYYEKNYPTFSPM